MTLFTKFDQTTFCRYFLLTASMAVFLGLVQLAHAQTSLPPHIVEQFGSPPSIPTGEVPTRVEAAIETAFVTSMKNLRWRDEESEALALIAQSKDPRLAWIISDMMRFANSSGLQDELATAGSQLLGLQKPDENHWGILTDHLIAWDVPAPPGYLDVKRAIFTSIVPGWDKLFIKGNIDWRLVSWGGVLIDDRAYDKTDEICNCIPASDNPEVSSADEANWLKDSDIVFGIEVNGETRAYPRRIMEVREMVNDTLGGRLLAIPYCTLCGAAQAYFTDQLPENIERPVLRTSGLLIRSNKVMYDVNTHSIFDTFRGDAVTGPLAEKKIKLQQTTVITTDWGSWKRENPKTTVLVERLALGRDFDFRNTRDANGPIFPIGDVDPRLPVHEDVIGVITASGRPIAFQRSKAFTALKRGEEITIENIRLVLNAGGIKAVTEDGGDARSHQAFWFAWSQFHPSTELWDG